MGLELSFTYIPSQWLEPVANGFFNAFWGSFSFQDAVSLVCVSRDDCPLECAQPNGTKHAEGETWQESQCTTW